MSLLDGDSKYLRQVDIDLDNDVAILPFSSGTTGVPKGVMLSQKNLVEYNLLFWSDTISHQFQLFHSDQLHQKEFVYLQQKPCLGDKQHQYCREWSRVYGQSFRDVSGPQKEPSE